MRNIIIIILLFSILFLGSITLLPGLTIRNIAVVCLLLYAVRDFRKISLDIAEKAYLLFIITLLLCNILNGNIATFSFIQSFVSYHLVCLVIIMFFPLIIKTNRDLLFITKILIVFYVVNVFVTYLQFINVPIGWDLAYLITPGFEDAIDDRMVYLESLDDLTSIAVTPGIIGFVVTNGYFVASFLPIVSYMFLSNRIKHFCLGLILIGIGLAGLFMIQQRAAFLMGVLCVLILLSVKAKRDWMLPLIMGIILLFVAYPYLETIDMGRLVFDDVANDNRTNLLEFFFAYFDEEKFWLGGETDPLWLSSLGHNTIFSALLQGGIFSMIVYIVVLTIICIECFVNLYKSEKTNNIYTFVYALSCCLFVGVSLTHSMGIQSGAVMFWIPYVLMKQSMKLCSTQNVLIARYGKVC